MEVLRAMPLWSWDEYKNALAQKGYTVHERKDKKGTLRGYALVKGNTKYKASELGIGKKPDDLETSCDMGKTAPSVNDCH